MQNLPDIPTNIQQRAERFFGLSNTAEGLKILQLSQTFISFHKGSPDSYLIVSGIVKSSQIHECKIVYKKRLEDSQEGPLKSHCDCHTWSDKRQCPHTASLYLSFFLQIHTNTDEVPITAEDPSIANNSLLGVKVEEYGTIIDSAAKLVGPLPCATYTSLRYVLSNSTVIGFPIPKTLQGTIIVDIPHGHRIRVRFLHKTDSGLIHRKISLFENLYLFNWETGCAYHLSGREKEFIQKLRYRNQLIDANEVIKLYQKAHSPPSIQLVINGKNFENIEEEAPELKLFLNPQRKKNLIEMNMVFSDADERAIPAPEFLCSLTFSGGRLHTFKTKRDSYLFITSLYHSIIDKNDEYKKIIYLSNSKDKWPNIIDFLRNNEKSFYYSFETQKKYAFKNSTILAIFTAIYKYFGENLFRYSSYSIEKRQLNYRISSQTLFNKLGKFYSILNPLGLSIYYKKNKISSWDSGMRFTRKTSKTKWFDLELDIGNQDLEVVKKADIDMGIVFTKKGLILLDQNQRELLKFMKKHLNYNGLSLNPSTKNKKFSVSFSRSRIFELFEMKKLGLDNILTKEEEELCLRLVNLESIPIYPLSPTMQNTLRPYQKTGYNWLSFLYENQLGACLADDMGLGKTIQTIALICNIIDSIERILIVCPVSILLNWEKEFKKFSQLDIYIYHGGERKFPKDTKVILTSYGIMKKEIENTFEDKYFDILVLDEVQHLKNVRSLGAFAARKLRAKFRICLTGTPVENDLTEFYNILDLSMPGTWKEFHNSKHMLTKESYFHAKKTANPFVLRRTKDQVLTELPPKQEHNVFLNFTDRERQQYELSLKEIKRKIILSPKKNRYGEILKGLLELRQRCLWQGDPSDPRNIFSTKIEFLLIQLEQILKENHQVIVFSQFTTYLDIIEGFLRQKEWEFARIDGTQGISKRQREVDTFQAGRKHIFLISLKAGGVGLNLTAASYVFLMDPWWNPAVEQQAIDRAHRIGQKNTLIVYKPVIKNSIEERVLELKETKLELFEDLLQDKSDGDFFSGKLSMKDFEHFFEEAQP